MKFFITDFKKERIYGDCYLEGLSFYFSIIGTRIKVKILGIFWITYKQFKKL